MTRPLRLLFIGNAHSVHVRSFISYFARGGHDVSLVTPEQCLFDIPGVRVINVAPLSAEARLRRALREIGWIRKARLIPPRVRTEWRHRMLPPSRILAEASAQMERDNEEERLRWNAAADVVAPVLDRMIAATAPDIVQALRFYPEGLIAARSAHPRRSIFVWGSDISGYGTWYPEVGAAMRDALASCAGVLHDNAKDYRFALEFGLPPSTPHLMAPSNGGIDTTQAPPPARPVGDEPSYATYRRMGNLFMNNEPVVRAMAMLRARGIPARYTMYGYQFGPYYDRLRALAGELGVWRVLHFEPPFAPAQVRTAIDRHRLQVSPAIDDGTSAALLETLWLGAVPIYSDVESIREWVVDGKNGYLFNLNDPAHVADRLERAFQERGDLQRLGTFSCSTTRSVRRAFSIMRANCCAQSPSARVSARL